MRFARLKDLYPALRRPGVEFRSLPFWGWNARLDKDELRRQIADMKDKGMGGAFIHSREGLETVYLSDEWMEDVRCCADACKDKGLELWIYDEDKWPSGSAGGMVAAGDPQRYAARGLTLEVRPWAGALASDDTIVAQAQARVEGHSILALGEGDALLILRQEVSRPSEWYNGHMPSDCLSAEAMQRFVDLTHERYKAALGDGIPGRVKGFFTDEPNFYDFFSSFTPGRPWLPWTGDLPEQFIKRRGYDPTGRLFSLFFDMEGCARLRHDYWRTLTELFGERCLKPMYDWCEAHGLRLTGHMLYENDLGYNIRVCGAAMPQYRYLHAPGVDLLGEQTREYLTLKQTTSAAHQYGRDMVITETYGCTGWQFDFEGQKWLGDWQFVMGVTRRCQHLMEYAITGCRKRDYPPVFNYQNTWWDYNGLMEDYFARLSACAAAGEVRRDILVIHPISSLWTKCAAAPDEDLSNIEMNMGWKDPHFVSLNAEGDAYNRLAEALVRAHWDFDFGDETILAEMAEIDGAMLKVGEGSYDTVVVPPVCSLFRSTCDLLERFVAGGGRVIWMDEAPSMVEGVIDDRPARLHGSPAVLKVDGIPRLLSALEASHPNALRVHSRLGMEDENLLTMLRRTGDGALLLAVNHSRSEGREVCFRVSAIGRVVAYDPWEDRREVLPCQPTDGATEFIDTLPPAGSRVYFIEADQAPLVAPPRWAYAHPHRADQVFAALGPVAAFRRDRPNALTLDTCRCALNGEALSGPMEVWQAQRRMRDRLGMQQVYYNGAPQRYTWLDKAASIPGAPFELAFPFQVDEVPDRPCRLAVERPEGLEVRLNGVPCARAEGWFMDRGIGLFDLPPMKPGHNEIALRGQYTADRELEDMYLIGDFAVSIQRHVVREPEALHFGDWCLQGYPHYAGSMVYRFELPDPPRDRRIRLRMGDYAGALAEIRVNGRRADVLFGACRRETDLTKWLKPTGNVLEIAVVGTPRNLMGPFHQAYDGCSRISWEDFRTEGSLHSEGYVLKPCGLMGQITLFMDEA